MAGFNSATDPLRALARRMEWLERRAQPISPHEYYMGQGLTKTSSYSLTEDDRYVLFDGSGLTATLPDPAIVPSPRFVIKNLNVSSLTIDSVGGATLDGAASLSIGQWGSRTFITTGTQWLTV